MASVRTALVLQDTLVNRVDRVARRLRLSRSQVFSQAADEFLEKHEGKALLEAINAAVGEPDPSEREEREAMRHLHRRAVAGEW
jgi:metal-responsive CopG/Arc/MetJ family transcriptional regulator